MKEAEEMKKAEMAKEAKGEKKSLFGISLPSMKNFGKDKFIIMVLSGILLFIIAIPVDSNGERQNTENSLNGQNVEGIQTGTKREETGTETPDTETAALSGEAAYTADLEKRLASSLSYMEGVGRVKVMITLQSSAEKVIEKDIPASRASTTETDAEGGSRSVNEMDNQEMTVYETEENGAQTPYVVKNMEPTVEGVVVVAEGGGNEEVRKNITEAIQALFNIEAHKIKVVKMKTG